MGTPDVGKTTLCRILLSYALKSGTNPLFVDLDPNQGTISIPTTIGAVAVDRMDVEAPNGMTMETSPPLIYSFGYQSPAANKAVYHKLVKRMAEVVDRRVEEDEKIRHGGLLIDTHRWTPDCGYEMLRDVLDAFRVDVVLAVGHERLFNELSQKLANDKRRLTLLRLNKSGGVSWP